MADRWGSGGLRGGTRHCQQRLSDFDAVPQVPLTTENAAHFFAPLGAVVQGRWIPAEVQPALVPDGSDGAVSDSCSACRAARVTPKSAPPPDRSTRTAAASHQEPKSMCTLCSGACTAATSLPSGRSASALGH